MEEMREIGLLRLASRFAQKAREVGVREAIRLGIDRLSRNPGPPAVVFPLMSADQTTLLAVNTAEIRAQEKQMTRRSSLLVDASQVESTYPDVFRSSDRIMRYRFLPAQKQSRGLVVLFHGHNAYLHAGPMAAWTHFDVLAPWDTFGWNRQGSWFWGEQGNNFVERIVQELIIEYRSKLPGQPWFCMGASMGGFGALYHGLKYGCNGIYVMAPQVDLRAKVIDYGRDNRTNPYGYLQGETLETVPDLLGLAEQQETLPPLFLTQRQYDPVNFFADHGFRLLDVYNRKHAWYGVRVHPAIGHGADGSQPEAEFFFLMILEKCPPHQVPFRQKPAQGEP
jgi:pimeloyl-ACP methyl ester carboxylesterase